MRAGEVLLAKGYGLADVEQDLPVTPATVFRLASITKVFTSTAVLMLADRGMLDLDDAVIDLLPEYPSFGRAMTVQHLMAHTAGLPEYLDRADFAEFIRRDYTAEQLIDSFRDRPRRFAPGERDAYSNANYLLLGAIIERVSGLSYAEFLRINVFDPLSMGGTACNAALTGRSQLAEAYEPMRNADGEPDWTRFVVARPYTMSSLYSAGGCVSSAEDLSAFHDALFGGRLLSEARLAHSLEPVRLAGGEVGSTANGGWQVARIGGHAAVMKGGSMPGVCTWYLAVPDEALAIILLSNRTPGQPRCGRLTVRLAGIVLESQ
jgi:CubicO group peptidase (beta-lactamase class C family)